MTFEPDYMIRDGGEIFYDLAAMYRERNTLYDVNMAVNELELRLATLEKKHGG